MTQNRTNPSSECSTVQFKKCREGKKKVLNDQEQTARFLSSSFICGPITHKDGLHSSSLKKEEKKYN